MLYGPSDKIVYVNHHHTVSLMHVRFAKFIHARPNMMSRFCLSHRILNKIKDHTIFPILWVNEVSANEAYISLKHLVQAKTGPKNTYDNFSIH